MNIKYYTPKFFHELADTYEQAADACEMYVSDFEFDSEGCKAKLYATKTLR